MGERETQCDCGRTWAPPSIEVVVATSALQRLSDVTASLMARTGCRGAVLLFDATTWSLFGERVLAPVRRVGIDVRPLVLGNDARPFEPDEGAVRTVMTAVGDDAKTVLIGVGSGAMNDLAKHISVQRGLPYISVATAPSMDGFAAPISALIVNRVKTTVPSRCPDAIIADLDIVAGAPSAMIAAGFGDVVGKATSLADWALAQALWGEERCARIATEVGAIAASVMNQAEAIGQRKHEAVGDLTQALIAAGTSVVHVGNSRPTSGAEHLIAHFVEMWHANRGKRPPMHGHVVGVATLYVCRLAEMLRDAASNTASDTLRVPAPQDVLTALRIDSVPDNFGVSKFDRDRAARRRIEIEAKWEAVKAILTSLPSAQQVKRALEAAGCPTRFSQLGLDHETALEALQWARYVRERYTLLDLASDVGLWPSLAPRLLAAEKA